jgi:hypothetical protein
MNASSSGALCDAMQAGVSVDSFPGLTHIATYMASTINRDHQCMVEERVR